MGTNVCARMRKQTVLSEDVENSTERQVPALGQGGHLRGELRRTWFWHRGVRIRLWVLHRCRRFSKLNFLHPHPCCWRMMSKVPETVCPRILLTNAEQGPKTVCPDEFCFLPPRLVMNNDPKTLRIKLRNVRYRDVGVFQFRRLAAFLRRTLLIRWRHPK